MQGKFKFLFFWWRMSRMLMFLHPHLYFSSLTFCIIYLSILGCFSGNSWNYLSFCASCECYLSNPKLLGCEVYCSLFLLLTVGVGIRSPEEGFSAQLSRWCLCCNETCSCQDRASSWYYFSNWRGCEYEILLNSIC